MIFVEMELTDGVQTQGSQMISPIHISEVEEMGENVRLHMASGNTYLVTGATFAASLNAFEGAKYLKINREPPKEVEGELVD